MIWVNLKKVTKAYGPTGVVAAPRQHTPRGARVHAMRPPPVHLGAGDPAGRAEAGEGGTYHKSKYLFGA